MLDVGTMHLGTKHCILATVVLPSKDNNVRAIPFGKQCSHELKKLLEHTGRERGPAMSGLSLLQGQLSVAQLATGVLLV